MAGFDDRNALACDLAGTRLRDFDATLGYPGEGLCNPDEAISANGAADYSILMFKDGDRQAAGVVFSAREERWLVITPTPLSTLGKLALTGKALSHDMMPLRTRVTSRWM